MYVDYLEGTDWHIMWFVPSHSVCPYFRRVDDVQLPEFDGVDKTVLPVVD